MLRKRPSIYFFYVVIGVALFLWLIFALTTLINHSLGLGDRSLMVLSVFPSLIGSFIIIFALSAATPLISDFLVTLRRLLRFDNLSNPILLKLSLNAPGTYHHSINVSNLAHKAAKAIGSDSLLVRVAAYYHDIGKLENPEFFIENQTENGAPTTNLSPQKSASIIISHVEKGLKLAKQNNVTDDICDLIAQHHGTTLVNYFYESASKDDHKTLREDFRYPGPKPHSKEAGILMIADCSEAAIRSLRTIHKSDIETTVTKIILDKIDQNQLDSSGLTERELKIIKTSMIDTLNVIYHRRIIS